MGLTSVGSPFSAAQQQPERRGYILAVTGAANNGSGLIRITTASNTLKSGDRVTITAVGGTVEANGSWFITRITATTFDLLGSTFTNAYTSGGSVKRG